MVDSNRLSQGVATYSQRQSSLPPLELPQDRGQEFPLFLNPPCFHKAIARAKVSTREGMLLTSVGGDGLC